MLLRCSRPSPGQRHRVSWWALVGRNATPANLLRLQQLSERSRWFKLLSLPPSCYARERRRRRAAGLPSDEALRLASTWLRETDHLDAHADFALIGWDRRATISEAEQGLFDLTEGADGEGVQAIVDRLLISAGWPARQHTIGSIRTRRQVADVDLANTAELSAMVRRGL
jgi:hypothetical protein